jgi:hypothetical protein
MKLTKFFAFAVAALAFVGCGNEPAPAPAPAPEVSGNIKLSADKTIVNVGDVVTFTVTDTSNTDLTSFAAIYDQDANMLDGNTYTATETGTYEFFAMYDGESSNTVEISVMASMPDMPEDSDPNNYVFQHRPIVIDHTGVGCKFCPRAMDALLALEKSSWHGKYNEVTCHAGDFVSGDPAASTAASTLNSFQSKYIGGYPSIVVNFTTATESYPLPYIEAALRSVYEDGGTNVGISMAVSGDDENIYCIASIKSEVAKEYYVNAWLLENNIYSPNQAGASQEYHKYYNYALRNFSEKVTVGNIAGLNIGTVEAKSTYNYACTIPLLSSKWASNNMGVLVVVSAKNANGVIEVVNSAYCKINEALEFEYI